MNQQPACMEFLNKIEQQFSYLFTRYGFLVARTAIGHSDEKCLVVLESAKCRLKFFYDRGFVETFVGTSAAPMDWADTYDSVRYWYSLKGVVDFVSNAPMLTPEKARELGYTLFSMTTDELLAYTSDLLRPVCEPVFELFREETFRNRQSEFERFYFR